MIYAEMNHRLKFLVSCFFAISFFCCFLFLISNFYFLFFCFILFFFMSLYGCRHQVPTRYSGVGCSTCGYSCGRCSTCGYSCGRCSTCGYSCGRCSTCGYSCGRCSTCGYGCGWIPLHSTRKGRAVVVVVAKFYHFMDSSSLHNYSIFFFTNFKLISIKS